MASSSKKNRRKKKPSQEQGETPECTAAVEWKVAEERLRPLPMSSPGSTDHVHTPPPHWAGHVEQCDELSVSSTASPARSTQESAPSKSKRKKKKKNDSLHQTQDHSPKAPTKTVAHPSPHHPTDSGAHSSSSSPAQGGGGESSFELELEWCIAQLVIGSQRADASKAQRQENEKLVRVLRSEKTPLPRKRQLMRNLFGDYRSRMKKEPLPDRLKARSAPSISSIESKVSDSRGRFFKKSSLQQQQGARGKGKLELPMESVACSSSFREVNSAAVGQPVPFCFNFDVDSDQ